MEVKNVTIGELTSQLADEAKRLGYSEASIWCNWMPKIWMISKYYREQGVCMYDPATTEKYLRRVEVRFEAGEVSGDYFRHVRQITRRVNEFYLTGTLRVDATLHGTRYVLSSCNERLVDLFVTYQDYGTNTRDDAVWAVRKYLSYFERHGHETLSTVTVDDVHRFIFQVAAEVKAGTLHNLFLYLRYFHVFLKETGVEAPDCEELFSYKVYREMPIQGYVTDEELGRILNVIDTSTEMGKRNLAIILLGATTGMRACDIIHLKLTDIDWRKGEIRVEQSKTDQAVRLPLLNETSAAIQDYILNARPKNHCSELFLRCAAPRTAIWMRPLLEPCSKNMSGKPGLIVIPSMGKDSMVCVGGWQKNFLFPEVLSQWLLKSLGIRICSLHSSTLPWTPAT